MNPQMGDDFSQGRGANAAPNWKVIGKNPSGHEGASRPAQAFDDGIGFAFEPDPQGNKLFLTDHRGSLLGNLTGKTLTATFTIIPTGAMFTYTGEGESWNACGTPTHASVRLYFEASTIGPWEEQDRWWSNPQASPLTSLVGQPVTLAVPLDTASWYDKGPDGKTPQPASDVPTDFAAAVARVIRVGVSFGGGCDIYALAGGAAPTNGTASFVLKSYLVS